MLGVSVKGFKGTETGHLFASLKSTLPENTNMSKLIRKILNENFTISDTRIAQCKELDLLAKGLYFYLVSLPDDWNFSIERIARANNTTEGKVKNAIKQLEAMGLLKRDYYLHANGRRGITADYTVFDFDTRDCEELKKDDLGVKFLTPQKLGIKKEGVLINITKNQEYKELNYKSPRLQKPLVFSDSPQGGESDFASEGESEILNSEAVKPSKQSITSKAKEENPEFEKFWESYPNKLNKSSARTSFNKALKKGVSPQLIISKAKEYANYCNAKNVWTAHASTWLNQERYLNDYEELARENAPSILKRGSINYGCNEEDDGFF